MRLPARPGSFEKRQRASARSSSRCGSSSDPAQLVSLFSPPSRRGGRAELIMQRDLKKSARPGRSDALVLLVIGPPRLRPAEGSVIFVCRAQPPLLEGGEKGRDHPTSAILVVMMPT